MIEDTWIRRTDNVGMEEFRMIADRPKTAGACMGDGPLTPFGKSLCAPSDPRTPAFSFDGSVAYRQQSPEEYMEEFLLEDQGLTLAPTYRPAGCYAHMDLFNRGHDPRNNTGRLALHVV